MNMSAATAMSYMVDSRKAPTSDRVPLVVIAYRTGSVLASRATTRRDRTHTGRVPSCE
jgi:hypothetical protein